MDKTIQYKFHLYVSDVHRWDLYSRRAAYKVYQVYWVNKYELWLLSALYAYMQVKGRDIVAKNSFFRQITANFHFKKKLVGYYKGLMTRGMICEYEYYRMPGSECVGLTEKGVRALELYRSSFESLYEKDADKEFKPGVSEPDGTYLKK